MIKNNIIRDFSLSDSNMYLSIIFIGVFVRFRQYIFNRSLWLDESFLANNIINNNIFGLFQPLDHHQMAPIGFLLTEKMMVSVFGNSELALRLFPFLAAIVAIFLFYLILKRFDNKAIIILGLLLFCFSFRLTYYSSEVKQYSIDVLATTLCYFIYLKTNYLQKNIRTIVLTSLLAAILIWFSYPVVFVLFGIGISFLVSEIHAKSTRNIGKIFLLCSIWLLSFIINYLLFTNNDNDNISIMNSYWESQFAPLFPKNMSEIQWYISSIEELFFSTLGITQLSFFLIFITLIAIFSYYKTSPITIISLTLPIIITYFISGLKLYPFSNRLLLFLTPSLTILIALGASIIIQNTTVTAIRYILILFLILQPLAISIYSVFKPMEEEEVKPALVYYQNNAQENDLLYVYFRTNPAFSYYKARLNISEENIISSAGTTEDPSKLDIDIERLKKSERAWLLFSHNFFGEQEYMLDKVTKVGKILDEKQYKGASIYLVDFGYELGSNN